jgi:autotransporter translocation and assembly factor TamB
MKNKSGNDNLKIMNIKVSGTLKDPLVNFDLDGKGIEKEDAISYLIFGMKMDDLDFSQQSQMPNSTEDIAKDVGFSMLASMLQSSLGQSIGIDVIEIESDDNWETAPVTLGKYITNFLYMSYTYTFSLTNEKKDVEPYKLVLEYQVLRNLFLQGSNSGKDSGFDVFLKFGF